MKTDTNYIVSMYKQFEIFIPNKYIDKFKKQ